MKKFFESPLKFAEHLLKAVAMEEIALHEGLKVSVKLIEKTAKNKIGHYQSESGPFQDWAELADATKEDRVRKGYSENEPLLREGDLRDSIQSEVRALTGVVGSKSPIAAYQEYGTAKIPPRAFIGPAAFENKKKIKAILGFAAFEGITGGTKTHQSLGYDFTTDD
jgi:HK97 gp10 family phage protein